MTEKITIIIVIISFTILLLTANVLAGGPPDLVLLIMDQTGLGSIINTPTSNLDKLQKIGAFGLMNVRTAGGLKPESTYLTAGNGKKCKGSKYTHCGKNIDNGVINQHITNLQYININTTYKPFIGLMGKVCRVNNKKIAVYGNCDTNTQKSRTIVSMVMDENGFVDIGDVSKGILESTDTPWGYCTDWSVLKEKIDNNYQKASLLVIETGDMSRIEKIDNKPGEDQFLTYKSNALENIDKFIDYLYKKINFEQSVLGIIVLSPSRRDIKKGNKLTWILLAGKDIKHGWLTSATTRRKGIITITDILPTVFSELGVHNRETSILSGHKITSIAADKDWHDLDKLNKKITTISILRKPFIQGFIALQLFVITLAIVCIFNKKLYSSGIIQFLIEYILLTLFLIPLNFMIISLYNFTNLYYYLLLIVIMSFFEILLIVNLSKNKLKRILIISITLVVIILIDLLNNNFLMADSLLGYSTTIGARYYGLGNEYMGLLIGAAIISVSGIIELLKAGKNKYYRFISVTVFLLIIYFTGAPNLGANFGGTITAIIACSVTWLYLWGYKLNLRTIIITFSLLILIVWGIIYLDYNQVITTRTHIARAIEPLISGNYQEIINIMVRKIKMNIKLMKWTIWTRVLLAFLVYIIILFKQPKGKFKRLLSIYPLLASGFYGGIAGSIITLLVNDSGVVASATLLFYPMLTLLYLFNYLNCKENSLKCNKYERGI